MRHARSLAIVFVVSSSSAVLAGACGGGGETSSGNTGGASSGGTAGTTSTSMDGGGGLFGTGGSVECTSSEQCNGGVCVNGICCASADLACGNECCAAGTVCLFDNCVTPGKPCHTANDCDPGQYCETALGENAGTGGTGGGGGAGGLCTAPVPLEGKCLDLPPICDENGNPAGCVPACEYHPPAGLLDAELRWEWGTNAVVKPGFIDVWSTPTVGRVYDGNCDGKVDQLDPPNVIFVSGNATSTTTGIGTCCHCTGATVSRCLTGTLRMLDGRTGQEIWSLDKPSATSIGFAGLSTAIGDVDGDGNMDVLAVTGEGFVVMIDSKGAVVRTSDLPIPGNGDATFGWGGGLAIADVDHDGFPEIAYGPTLFTTTNGAITRLWSGTAGIGAGSIFQALSTFADLDGAADGNLELLAGRTAYKADGTQLWNRTDIPDGFPATGDFDGDGKPEVVIVGAGTVRVLEGATGDNDLAAITLPGNGAGGPPTVADFDGDGKAEIGVAQQNLYSMLKPNYVAGTLDLVWDTPNHDLSSSVTGSSVFDFEGDGKAEVIYADECFLWVFDGQTGDVRFATFTTSFTATEASVVADVDGDGHAEIIMVSNRADPSAAGWNCLDAGGNPSTVNGVTWQPSAAASKAYAGIHVFGDKANSWVGTRTLWNQHTYHVSNICDDRDTACDAPNVYGSIPMNEKPNWTLPWLNNFRQNVQDKGIFDAPDATVSLAVECVDPVLAKVSVRNQGLASLPKDVQIGIFEKEAGGDVLVGQTQTTHSLFPGQTEVLEVTLDATALKEDTFVARILIDPQNPTFHECKEDNNQSSEESATCVQ
jgi:hypothetical protein